MVSAADILSCADLEIDACHQCALLHFTTDTQAGLDEIHGLQNTCSMGMGMIKLAHFLTAASGTGGSPGTQLA